MVILLYIGAFGKIIFIEFKLKDIEWKKELLKELIQA